MAIDSQEPEHGARRRRPRDRKQQILVTAGRLFAERGYHNVSMSLIAEHLDITAGALYRHYSGKAELLNAVLIHAFEQTTGYGSVSSLDELLEARMVAVLRYRMMGLLWAREAGNLPSADYRALSARLRRYNDEIAALIMIERPDISADSAIVLGWAIQSVFASPGYHSAQPREAEFVRLMKTICVSLCRLDLPDPTPVLAPGGGKLRPVSQREALLMAAVGLFGEHGYQAASLADIGAVADVRGSSIYSYFDGKADMLALAFERGMHVLWLDLHRVLRENNEPRAALYGALDGYVDSTSRFPHLSVVREIDDLPEASEAGARHREYIDEWVALLRLHNPRLTLASARVTVYAALVAIDDLRRTRYVARRGNLDQTLKLVASGILGL